MYLGVPRWVLLVEKWSSCASWPVLSSRSYRFKSYATPLKHHMLNPNEGSTSVRVTPQVLCFLPFSPGFTWTTNAMNHMKVFWIKYRWVLDFQPGFSKVSSYFSKVFQIISAKGIDSQKMPPLLPPLPLPLLLDPFHPLPGTNAKFWRPKQNIFPISTKRKGIGHCIHQQIYQWRTARHKDSLKSSVWPCGQSTNFWNQSTGKKNYPINKKTK